MNQISQAPLRSRTAGMLILTLLLAVQGLVGVAAIVQTLIAASRIGVSFATLISDPTLRSGFYLIVIAAALSLILALVYWLVRRWTFWLILLAELVALFFGIIYITSNLLDWYSIPVFVALPILILIYMFADRNVRMSRKRAIA